MSGKMSRDKGQRAEREVVKLLQPIIDRVYEEFYGTVFPAEGTSISIPQLARNLVQSRSGGHDISGLHWIAIEVKHQETFALNAWWAQALQQSERTGGIPVLLYRRNGLPFRCKLVAVVKIANGGGVKVVADITLEAFMVWFEHALRASLA